MSTHHLAALAMLNSPVSHLSKPCKPRRFCARSFQRLGTHLKHCPHREGRDFQAYLSQKTLSKRSSSNKKKPCRKCGRLFYRLDTPLRNSAQCKVIPTLDEHNPASPTREQLCSPQFSLFWPHLTRQDSPCQARNGPLSPY